jgi:hypothetical protein
MLEESFSRFIRTARRQGIRGGEPGREGGRARRDDNDKLESRPNLAEPADRVDDSGGKNWVLSAHST